MNGTYRLGDAVAHLQEHPGEYAAICLDDSWARPHRNGAFGVTYPTHDFEQTKTVVDACFGALEPGGWLLADADDWLLPRLIDYIRSDYGDVAATYEGGGFRRIGGVTYLTQDGDVDRSGAGMYFANGGYPVVFAHKGETDRRTSASARQVCERERACEYGSAKPVAPYEAWLDGITDSSDTVCIPMAGSAPAAIACEKLGVEWVAIDIEEEAKEAFTERLNTTNATLSSY